MIYEKKEYLFDYEITNEELKYIAALCEAITKHNKGNFAVLGDAAASCSSINKNDEFKWIIKKAEERGTVFDEKEFYSCFEACIYLILVTMDNNEEIENTLLDYFKLIKKENIEKELIDVWERNNVYIKLKDSYELTKELG